jgi:hypothetical protein
MVYWRNDTPFNPQRMKDAGLRKIARQCKRRQCLPL